MSKSFRLQGQVLEEVGVEMINSEMLVVELPLDVGIQHIGYKVCAADWYVS